MEEFAAEDVVTVLTQRLVERVEAQLVAHAMGEALEKAPWLAGLLEQFAFAALDRGMEARAAVEWVAARMLAIAPSPQVAQALSSLFHALAQDAVEVQGVLFPQAGTQALSDPLCAWVRGPQVHCPVKITRAAAGSRRAGSTAPDGA